MLLSQSFVFTLIGQHILTIPSWFHCLGFTETCRCYKTLTTNYREFAPYVGINKNASRFTLSSKRLKGMIPSILENLAVSCCRACKLHGNSLVDFTINGKGSSAVQPSDQLVKSLIDDDTDFSFPIYGWNSLETYKTYYKYIPLVESPGIVQVAKLHQHEEGAKLIIKTVMETWPLIIITLTLALIAGIIIWFLVRCLTATFILTSVFFFKTNNTQKKF